MTSHIARPIAMQMKHSRLLGRETKLAAGHSEDYDNRISFFIRQLTTVSPATESSGIPAVMYSIRLNSDGSIKSATLRRTSGVPEFDFEVR